MIKLIETAVWLVTGLFGIARVFVLVGLELLARMHVVRFLKRLVIGGLGCLAASLFFLLLVVVVSGSELIRPRRGRRREDVFEVMVVLSEPMILYFGAIFHFGFRDRVLDYMDQNGWPHKPFALYR